METLLNGLESVYLVIRNVGFLLSPLKHFQKDPPGYRSEKFERVLRRIKPTLIQKTNVHWIVRCKLGSEIRETNIFLLHPFDSKKPSITFHHGAGQINHILPATFILGRKILDTCNVFVIKAQKHGSAYEYLSEAVDSFFHQQQTFAGSVLATEEIVRYHKKYSKKPIISSGASMGGIVATLHAFLFGTADYYVSIVAYPNVGEIFLGTRYRFAVDGWGEKRKTKEYLDSYRIAKPIARTLTKRIFPVLGKYDRIVPFAKAEAFWKKQGVKPFVYPYGHFTSIIKCKEIRTLIFDRIVN